MRIHTTTSYCPVCEREHTAKYHEVGNEVIYTVDCPGGTRTGFVSTDTSQFQVLRHFEPEDNRENLAPSSPRFLYVLDITDQCNFNCPVCHTNSGPDGKRFMTVAEALALGQKVRATGGTWVALTGGEPTLHPQLPEIVRALAKTCRLNVSILSNGLRFAEDAGFARRLKREGLRKVELQFDTLKDEVYWQVRGRESLAEKHSAVAAIRAAGLRLGLVVTVCNLNLEELGAILEHGLKLLPSLTSIVFRAASPAGRFPEYATTVDRESILQALFTGCAGLKLEPTDVVPVPVYPPWRTFAHPGCAALIPICRTGDQFHALARDLDLPRFYSMLNRAKAKSGFMGHTLLPLKFIWKCAKRELRWTTLRRVLSFLRGTGSQQLCLVAVECHMDAGTRDEERLRRCPIGLACADGFKSWCDELCSGTPLPPPGDGAPDVILNAGEQFD